MIRTKKKLPILIITPHGGYRVPEELSGYEGVNEFDLFMHADTCANELFDFGDRVAVGLTPEMLPMIVTVNLSKGAISMSKKKVIVKRLNAIQNFGAMDVLCTDKTGTLTQGKIVLEKHLDVRGVESPRVLHYGYMNSYFQTGLKNLMDEAILDHGHLEEDLKVKTEYHKIDEIPFDFQRRRMSVIVEDSQGRHILICKGAVEEIYDCCSHYQIGEEVYPLIEVIKQDVLEAPARGSAEGARAGN